MPENWNPESWKEKPIAQVRRLTVLFQPYSWLLQDVAYPDQADLERWAFKLIGPRQPGLLPGNIGNEKLIVKSKGTWKTDHAASSCVTLRGEWATWRTSRFKLIGILLFFYLGLWIILLPYAAFLPPYLLSLLRNTLRKYPGGLRVHLGSDPLL